MFLPAPDSVWLEHHTQPGLRVAMVGAVVVTSVFLAPRASLHEVIVLGTLLVGAGGLLAVVRVPALGPLALVISCLLVPFSIGTGTDSSINAGILCLTVLIGLWILDMVWRADGRLCFSRPMLPLLALVGVATLSFALGVQPQLTFAQTAPLPAQVGGLAIFWLSAGAFLLVGHQVRDPRWIERLTWTFVGLGAIYIVGRVIPPFASLSNRALQFQSGVASGSLLYVWIVALAFGQAAFNRRLRLPVRLALAAIVVATLYLGFFRNRDWSSGWVPPLVAIVVALWFAAPRLAFPLLTLGAGAVVLKASAISGLLLNDYKQYDVVTRTAAWSTLLNVIKVNPVLGLGPANYYWYTPLFSILGYNLRFNSHNNYMDLIAQTGVIGLICFLWFAWEVGRLGVQLLARVEPGFARAYVIAALGGLAGTLFAGLLGDWFLPFVYNVGLAGFRASVLGWVFLGGLLALERHVNRDATSGSAADAVQASR